VETTGPKGEAQTTAAATRKRNPQGRKRNLKAEYPEIKHKKN